MRLELWPKNLTMLFMNSHCSARPGLGGSPEPTEPGGFCLCQRSLLLSLLLHGNTWSGFHRGTVEVHKQEKAWLEARAAPPRQVTAHV